jgi:transcription antitermination factor NusA-like protein
LREHLRREHDARLLGGDLRHRGDLLFVLGLFCALLDDLRPLLFAVDVDAPAGELRRQPDVLTFFADGERELVFGNDGFCEVVALAQVDRDDLRGLQGVGDVRRRVRGPLDDVDLLPVQLLADIVDARAARSQTCADGVDVLFFREDRHFRTRAGFARDVFDLDQPLIDLGKAEAILPLSEQVPHESFRIGSRVRVYVMEARKTNKGPQIVVSRAHPNVVRRLFETEIPEVAQGLVELKDISREPGSRSKVSVWTDEEDIDAVGACLGPRSSRINNISDELHGEKIDVIQWSPDTATYVANALQPAKVMQVHLNERQHLAEAVVPDHQLSLAIGKEGQNVRLAARLTGWRIDIHNEEQWGQVVTQHVEEEKELEEVAAMAEAAAQESGVELTPELLAQDEDLIRRLQELQRGDEEESETSADAGVTEDAADGAEKTGASE